MVWWGEFLEGTSSHGAEGLVLAVSPCPCSVWEIIGQSDGGLSVLRTFRLLRVLKLVRFMPALRRQLVVLMKTMDNVATFCMLLMLFIFIFRCVWVWKGGCLPGKSRSFPWNGGFKPLSSELLCF